MSLLEPGYRYRISGFGKTIDRYYKSKLLAMGLLPNQTFDVIRKAPLGNTIEIRIGQSSLSIRLNEFSHVQCERLS